MEVSKSIAKINADATLTAEAKAEQLKPLNEKKAAYEAELAAATKG